MGLRTDSITKFEQTFSRKILIYKVQVEFSKEFLEIKNEQISIGIKSNPVKGEANKEIINKLARHFMISTTCVKIKSGHKLRQKIIEVLQ